MFEVVYQWFRNIWLWICPTRSSTHEVSEIVDWDTSYPPAQRDPLRSNHTSDPNFVHVEDEPYASSSTGAVVWGTHSDIDIEI